MPDRPLIPRRKLFDNPTYFGPRLSPGGQHISWLAPVDGADRMCEKIVKAEEKAQADLTEKGMTITNPDKSAFRKKLVDAGFYKEWKDKFKPEMWAALEQAAGQSL